MQPKTLRHVLQLVLLVLLSNAAAIKADKALHHICHFDEIHKSNSLEAAWVESPSRASVQKQYMRIKFSTADLDDTKKHCSPRRGQVIKDALGAEVYCNQARILQPEMKKVLIRIVKSAIAMHAERLKVRPITSAFKVPTLVAPLCKMMTVPKDHRNTGITDADFMLYVASFPSSKYEMFAAGEACAYLADDKRSVIGALTFNPEHIEGPMMYNVRVAAHEIAHALGFTNVKMRISFGTKFLDRVNLRGKNNLDVLDTFRVTHFPKVQYDCGQLRGVELEDEKGVLSVPSRSHWKRRNVMEELMVGIVTAGYYSYLTLAFFHDLGYYEADFSKAEKMDWGTGGGCNFLDKRCIGDEVDNSRYFCSARHDERLLCAPGRRAMGKCSLIEAADHLPPTYQYFWDAQIVWIKDYFSGEAELLTDRCPIYEEQEESSCTDEESEAPGVKGPDSWCLRKRTWTDGNSIESAVCAKVAFLSDSGMYVQTVEGKGFSLCQQHGGYFPTALVSTKGKIDAYECPSVEEVMQVQSLQKLINTTNSTNENNK